MEIEFDDKRLALIQTARANETRLPFSVIKSCQEKLAMLAAAPDERTLRNLKSLRYEKLKGNRQGLKSIRINRQYRLVFELDESNSHPKIIVLSVEDYH